MYIANGAMEDEGWRVYGALASSLRQQPHPERSLAAAVLFAVVLACFLLAMVAPSQAQALSAARSVSDTCLTSDQSVPANASPVYAGKYYYFNLAIKNSDSEHVQTTELYVTFNGKKEQRKHNESAGAGRQMIKSWEHVQIETVGSFSYYWKLILSDGSVRNVPSVTMTAVAQPTTVTLNDYSGTYDGGQHTFSVSAVGSGNYTYYYSTSSLLTSSNYASSGSTTKPTRTNAGTSTVYVYIKDNSGYYESRSVTALIRIKAKVTASSYIGLYDTKEHTPSVSASGNSSLYYSTSTALTYSNYSTYGSTQVPSMLHAGSMTVYYIAVPAYGADSYTSVHGSVSLSIAQRSVAVPQVRSDVYTGSSLVGLASGTYYTRGGIYSVTSAGMYTCWATLVGNTGDCRWADGTTAVKSFNWCVVPSTIDSMSVSITGAVYTGSAQMPKPRVSYGTYLLEENTDYSVAYEDNTNAGTATAIITGKGKFSGSCRRTFVIYKAASRMAFALPAYVVKLGTRPLDNKLTFNGDGVISYSSSDSSVAAVDARGGITLRKVGTTTITARAHNGHNYGDASAQYTIVVVKDDPAVTSSSLSLSKKRFAYNGRKHAPTVNVRIHGVLVGDHLSSSVSNLYVKIPNKARKVGRYYVNVEGRNLYTGKGVTSFDIVPSTPKIRSLKSAKSVAGTGVVAAKWSKSKGASGYEVRLSTSKKFSKQSTKTSVFKTSSKIGKKRSCKGAGLKRHKRYYVKVRGYKVVDGRYFYSSWSKVKRVKTR